MALLFKVFFSWCLLSLVLINSAVVYFESDNSSEQTLQKSQNQNKVKNQKQWQFSDFKKHYGKNYASEAQEAERSSAFNRNMKKLKENWCTSCGVTSLMDKTQEQLRGLRGLLPGKGDSSKINQINTNKRLLQVLQATSPVIPPKVFDWRKYNVVSPVKNQKECGSCWAFTTTAFFESELVRRNQTIFLVDLAQQFLLQCDKSSFGCQGGYLGTALQVALNSGLPRQYGYPYNYTKSYSGMCEYTDFNLKLKGASNAVGYFSKITRMSDDQIIQLLLQRPLMIGVSSSDWTFYKPTDTYRTIQCRPLASQTYGSRIDHAVLLVGFTETEWIIKNSWGIEYGVGGYAYVSRDPLYNCGVGFYVYTLDFALPIPKF